MARIVSILEGPVSTHDPKLKALKEEFDRLSESTVAEKSQLNWPHAATLKNVAACTGLFVRENLANLFAQGRGELSPAISDQKLAPPSTTPSPAAPKP